jgi:hypothetical protein
LITASHLGVVLPVMVVTILKVMLVLVVAILILLRLFWPLVGDR